MTAEPPRPATTPQAEADRQARLTREADALRANLRRRKEQARAREARGVEFSPSVPFKDNLNRF